MSYPIPPESKSAVRRAGRRIADGAASTEDFVLVDRWRSSHGYVINTFQAWLKGHFKKFGFQIEFAQRLKRHKTVIDKICRRDADEKLLISDLTSMHDFAGCRLIFDNLSDLEVFREHMNTNSTMRNVDHELRHHHEKYDYIQSPKPSGYRGIHDVYRHYPRGHKRGEDAKKPWDGLAVEIQYRTRAQHAWATAVEISDLLDNERTKFSMTSTPRGDFFAIASEIIARKHENKANALKHLSLSDLERELQKIEDSEGILRRLEVMRRFEYDARLKRHNVLNIYTDGDGQLSLDVHGFNSPSEAILLANELEQSRDSINAVYVRSDSPSALQSAYRNYFNDPVDFVKLLRP